MKAGLITALPKALCWRNAVGPVFGVFIRNVGI